MVPTEPQNISTI